ncbi:MAG: ABC transporter ATP-binding protein [bacterium]
MTLEFAAERQLGQFAYAAEFQADDEILVLFGHSGAGKSLTLQFAAGLMRPDRGRIALGGATLFDSAANINLPPQQRRVGYVVQELALFEHLNVAENIAFGLPKGRDRAARVNELLALLDLTGFEKRRTRSLSGGQRQRVALARAIAREAPLLLLDEPFSALDDSLRTSMRKELLRLRAELGLTILFVTHDLREAHFLADRVAVFDNGRILQIGAREEIFKRPNSRRVAQLTGIPNVWQGTVSGIDEGTLRVTVEGVNLHSSTAAANLKPGSAVDVMVRAERINLRRELSNEPQGPNFLTADVTSEYAYGSTHTIHLKPVGPGPEMEVEIAARPYEVLGIASRKRFTIEIEPGDIHVVAAS